MAHAESTQFRHRRNSACGCTVHGEIYCSKHCEEQASSAILAGQGCQCGHGDCAHDEPPAA